MGAESRNGGVYNRPVHGLVHASLEVTSSITAEPGRGIEQRHACRSFLFMHVLILLTLLSNVYVY